MAKITKGYTFGSTELVTNTKLHTLIDDGTVTEIVNADVDASAAIDSSKLSGVASDGANSDITSLSGLTTPLSVAQGGTGSATQNFVDNDGTVNPTNLLSNGDFESWSAGASAAPDGYTAGGAGVAVAKETTIIKMGTASASVTRSGADCYIFQDVQATRGITYWKGRTVTFGCWVYATVADRARLLLYDGVAQVESSFHTGDSTWQWLSVTQTVDGSATQVGAYCSLETGDTTAYFDGAMCVEGSSAFAFSPKPAEEGVWADYSAVSTVVGWSSFTTKLIYTKKIGKTVFVSFFLHGVSNGTTISFTLPYKSSNTLGIDVSAGVGMNNSSVLTSPGRISLPADSTTVTCHKDMSSGAWTNSNNKYSGGQFLYESA